MNIKVIRSARKTFQIEIRNDLTMTVRAPAYATDAEIRKILYEKREFIEKALEKVKRSQMNAEETGAEPLTEAMIKSLAGQAMSYIPERVKYYSGIIGVSFGRITIRNQKTRWGSCSSEGNLNFNCLLMLTSPEVIDYVVVHELCHRKEMNHSKAFWNEVEKVLPDYKMRKKRLKEEGEIVMRRAGGR